MTGKGCENGCLLSPCDPDAQSRVRAAPLTTVRDFFRHLAGLGGFLMRKHDGDPGWITLWRGLDKLILAVRRFVAIKQKCG